MAALKDTFQALSGNLQKIQEQGHTTVKHIVAANVDKQRDDTELTLPNTRLAIWKAAK